MINTVSLRREYQAATRDRTPERFWGNLSEGLIQGELTPDEFSVRALFEEFVEDGRELARMMDPRQIGGGYSLMEAGDAVDTSTFSNVFGQVIYASVIEQFNDPVFIGNQLARNVPTRWNGEKIPGVAQIGDAAEDIGEGEEYPTAGVSEEWIEIPRSVKKGFIIPVTREVVFFDNTNLVLQRARDVSKWMGVNKEKRILDTALGLATTYRRNGREAVATYGDNSGDHDWDNLAANNPLVDWTSVEVAELLFDGIIDPNTGEPVSIVPNTLVVPTSLKHTARRIVNATQIEHVDNQASANTIRTTSGNLLDSYNILSSPYVKSRTGSDSSWFFGDFMSAFSYREIWPLNVQQAPPNSEAEFSRDIVSRFKASEWGTPAVIEPRYVVKSTD